MNYKINEDLYDKLSDRVVARVAVRPNVGNEDLILNVFGGEYPRTPEGFFRGGEASRGGELSYGSHFYWEGVALIPGLPMSQADQRSLSTLRLKFMFTSVVMFEIRSSMALVDPTETVDAAGRPYMQAIGPHGRPMEIIAMEGWRASLIVPPGTDYEGDLNVVFYGTAIRLNPGALKAHILDLPEGLRESGVKGGWIKPEWFE